VAIAASDGLNVKQEGTVNRSKPTRLISRATLAAALILTTSVGAAPVSAVASDADAVLVWNEQAVIALGNPLPTAIPPPPVPGAGMTPVTGGIHLAIVQGAVYDAVNAIEGGHQPYLSGLPDAPASASKAAAVATAAHDVLVAFPPMPVVVKDRLDDFYANYLADIPDSADKTAGISIGAAAASAMLANRVGDGRYGTPGFPVGDEPGEWVPTPPLFINDPFAWVADVTPFTLLSESQFRTAGPDALDSPEYAADFNEVKALGAATGSTRTPEQTALAQFVSTSPFAIYQRAVREMPEVQALSTADQARLFAQTSMTAADSLIGCWDDKAQWLFWRPSTAIPAAGSDNNPATEAQADWLPFFANPPYPEHPSGFNCFSSSMARSLKAFFGTNAISITLKNPAVGQERTYDQLSKIVRDTINGRIYMGIHFRNSDVQGAWIGKKVAHWVDKNYFQPVE
jgi:hypothetical protein